MRRELSDVDIFLAVAREGGLRRAAGQLGIAASSVSERLGKLETQLGVRLFNRSTRSLAMTPAGDTLFAKASPAIDALDSALRSVTSSVADEVAGTLRLNASPPAAEFVLAPLVAPFLDAFPAVDLEIVIDDALVDIVKGGFDAGVRYEETLSADMITVSLSGPQRYRLVAAPRLVAKFGEPADPTELTSIPAVRHRLSSGRLLPWEFEQAERICRVEPKNRLVVTDAHVGLRAAIDGVGAFLAFEEVVAPALAARSLQALLDDWLPQFRGPFLYYFSGRLMRPPLRAFIDFARRTAVLRPDADSRKTT